MSGYKNFDGKLPAIERNGDEMKRRYEIRDDGHGNTTVTDTTSNCSASGIFAYALIAFWIFALVCGAR